ncbi:unnamed protein product [Lactuca virosa]|uniref:SWIM-type domain-containing protein n=1 Tax=Lactuca virosa TaxID=75947 RepID=A0AAU9LEZ5_9ASTR|nr:unnamed protein product [Lactuca virosa]
MLEEMRIYIMDRFAYMNVESEKWNSNVCPKILKKMNRFGKNMRFWGIIHSQGHVFEARRGCDSYRVDLDDMTCSCRLWDLAGIPCVHANAAINFIHQTPYAYINAYFSKDKFRQCYSTNIEPVNGSNLWAQTEYIKPLPPMSRRMPGRPATKRKRHASEKESEFSTTKVKVARTTRCGNCLEYGHNKRACKNERKQYVPPPPKKTGRPRKHPIPHVSTSPGQPNVPSQPLSQPSCSNTVRRSPRKHNTLTMSPRKHQQQAGSKRFRRNSIDVPRKKLCTGRGGGRIGSATIVVQEVPVIHIQDGHMMQEGESSQASVMEGSDTFGQSLNGDNEVEDNQFIEFTEGKEDDILPEKIQLGPEEIASMLEAGYSMAEIEAMPGVQVELDDSPPVELDVNDFIDGHHSDDDVGLDGGAEGAGDEAAGDGGLDDDVGLDAGPDHGVGYEAAGDGDEEGPGGGDVDDGDGPEGDGDEEGHGGGDVDDGEENQGDDEGHQVVPIVRKRTRKTSERITKIKLRKGVYDKDGGGSSSVKPINLE